MGKLYGIGVGPGDSELLTLKGARLIRECDVIVVPRSGQKVNVAYTIGVGAVPEMKDKNIVEVDMPMTRDKSKLKEAHKNAADTVEGFLREGKDVAFLTLGDPAVYSTYIYVHDIILERGLEAEIVPGVTSFCAVAARLNEGLTEASEGLYILPASYEGLEEALKLKGTKVLMKSGKAMGNVKKLISEMTDKESVRMVERCGMPGERIFNSLEEIDEDASYFSVLVVKER